MYNSVMKLGLNGKVVLITGGSKGIGLACARMFAEEGAQVAIASRSQDNLETAQLQLSKEGIKVIIVQADFSQAGRCAFGRRYCRETAWAGRHSGELRRRGQTA